MSTDDTEREWMELFSKFAKLSLPKEPKRPNKHTDRIAWNAHFERAISDRYSAYDRPSYTPMLMEAIPGVLFAAKSMGMPELSQSNAQYTRDIIKYEGSLISLAVEHMVYGTFEAEWKKTDVNKKKEIVLEGLYRGACHAPRDNSRTNCPEMTIDGLIGDGEYNLVNLLKRLIAHDPVGNGTGSGHVMEIYLFPHPYVSLDYRHTESAPDVLKAFQYYCVLLRNWYIIATLRGTLEAFYDIPSQPCVPIMTHSAPSEERKQAGDVVRATVKKAGIHVDNSQCREEALIKQYACYKCNTRTKDRAALKRCSRCKLAWYCSAACQSKDWQEHKKYCGQEQFDPKRLAPSMKTPDTFIGCPDPVPGFTRSPALLRQIWYLSKPDSQGRDYHFNLTFAHTRSLTIIHPCVQLVFLVARTRAMASGSKAAVYQMFRILEHQERDGRHNLTIDQIRSQFEREYLVTINSANMALAEGEWVPPTLQELKAEGDYLMQRLSRKLSIGDLAKHGCTAYSTSGSKLN